MIGCGKILFICKFMLQLAYAVYYPKHRPSLFNHIFLSVIIINNTYLINKTDNTIKPLWCSNTNNSKKSRVWLGFDSVQNIILNATIKNTIKDTLVGENWNLLYFPLIYDRKTFSIALRIGAQYSNTNMNSSPEESTTVYSDSMVWFKSEVV